MDEAFRMGLMHRQFDSMTQGERMELRVRRMIGQDPVPVRICVGRRSGKTEFLRRYVGRFDREKREAGDLNEQMTEDEALRRLRESMELAITERVQGVEWASELTPTTLRKVMQEMRKVKVPPMEDEPLKRLFLRMAISDQKMINHAAFLTVTEPTEEPMYKGEARMGWKP